MNETVKITVVGDGTYEVPYGKRLILALRDNDVDIMHRCGGNAQCTTCRVQVHAGEPIRMTVAEHDKISEKVGLMGKARLSCQILCEQDMTVEPLMTMANTGLESRGERPKDHITPPPIWRNRPY